MGILSDLATWYLKRQTRSTKFAGVPLRDPALVSMFGDRASQSGMNVDEVTALNNSAVWAAVNLLSSSVAMLPMDVLRIDGDTVMSDKSHPAYHVLHDTPNGEMTPYTLIETLMAHCLTWGNGYGQIVFGGDDPLEIWPIMPNQMRAERDKEGGLIYEFQAHFEGETDCIFFPHQIIHVPALTFDGVMGYGPVRQAREAIGLSLATESYGASFFGRGASPGGVIEHPMDLGEQGRKNLRESWEELHRGPDNSHRLAVLEEGATYKPIGFPPEEAQFLQTRQFQVVEIARWFNVPPHMIRDLANATFSNIEHQQIEFLMYSLAPWLTRFQQELKRKLFIGRHAGRYDIGFDTTALLRADITTRFAAYATARNGGWYTLNDILRAEGKNALPPGQGDVRLVPSTMQEMGRNPEVDMTKLKLAVDFARGLHSAGEDTVTAVLSAAVPDAQPALIRLVVADVVAAAKLSDAPVDGGNDLKSTVGGLQAIGELQRAVYAGQLPREAGMANAKLLFGFTDIEVDSLFPEVAPKATSVAEEPTPVRSSRMADVPVILQANDYSCGAAAYLSVARYLGSKDASQNDAIKALRSSPRDGTSPVAIVDIATESGLSVELYTDMTIDELDTETRGGNPVIAAIQVGDPTGDDSGHYVVVMGVENGIVHLMDPLDGKRSLPVADYESRWHDSGYDRLGIVFAKDTKREARLRLKDVIGKLKGAALAVANAALAHGLDIGEAVLDNVHDFNKISYYKDQDGLLLATGINANQWAAIVSTVVTKALYYVKKKAKSGRAPDAPKPEVTAEQTNSLMDVLHSALDIDQHIEGDMVTNEQ